jgi:NifB/MoaA-like Fe-S oxidoreductase
VVPVGYTQHQAAITGSYETPQKAIAVVDQIMRWQTRARESRGTTWVQAADELYLSAGVDVPPSETYDGYPQYENGVGLVRSFIDEFFAERPSLDAARAPGPTPSHAATVLTGELFAEPLRALIAESGLSARVLGVPNRFFGGNVSVTGLLTAADIDDAVSQDGGVGPYLLPDVVFNDDGLTLDDATFEQMAAGSPADLRLVSCDATALVTALNEFASLPPEPRGS